MDVVTLSHAENQQQHLSEMLLCKSGQLFVSGNNHGLSR